MTAQEPKPSSIRQVPKVLYAPHKVFREIVKGPKYAGAVLIFILFIAANVGFWYVILSKSYLEQTLPLANELDQWNENATKWAATPGAAITESFDDFINGSYYGNRSIKFTSNSSQLFMELAGIGPIDCSKPNGFVNVSLRVKFVDPQANLTSASIYLFSQAPSEYFYYDLTNTLSNSSSNVWNNLTIPLATENWQNYNANWTNINGLKLQFSWPGNSNTSVLVNGLFFRGIFKNPLETEGPSYLISYGIVGVMQFAIEWIFLSGLIFIIARALKAKAVWKPILVSVGFALIILFVQTAINAITVSTLPNLYYPLEYIGGTGAEMDAASTILYNQTWLASTIMSYLRIVVFVWIIALCATATRALTEFSWVKSALVATIAFVVTTVVSMLIGV